MLYHFLKTLEYNLAYIFVKMKTHFNFNFGFISSGIYGVQRCLQSGKLEADLCTRYNKLAPPGMRILQVELLAQIQTGVKAKYFTKLFRVPLEKVLLFWDNQACLHLIQGFERNFLSYKPFYVRNCKKLLSYGIPLENYLWVPTKANIIDIATRLDTMEMDNIELFLGEWDPARHSYAKNSNFFWNLILLSIFLRTLFQRMTPQT